MTSVHLVLIDALNLIRRIEGGLRAIPNQSAIDPDQLISLVNQATKKLIRGHQPSHIVAVFDGDGDNWRKEIYPKYKENRKAMAPDLCLLLPAIKASWQQLGLHIIEPEHDEADDIIATLAYKVTQHNHKNKCTIISTDQGYLQLLPLGVAIWDHFNQQWHDETTVTNKYGLKSQQLLDYWAIVGQSGNKIPGVVGLGPKAALSILQQWGDLKQAFCAPPQSKTLEKLHHNKSQAQLSYRLVRFKLNIALGGTLSDYIYRPQGA